MRKKLHWLIPTIIAPEGPLATAYLDHLADEIADFFTYNRSFELIYRLCLAAVNLLPLFTRGRTLRGLKLPARQEYMSRLLDSRSTLLRGMATIVGLPVKMVFYNQDAEQMPLGFDPGALKKEAALRRVTRSRTGSS